MPAAEWEITGEPVDSSSVDMTAFVWTVHRDAQAKAICVTFSDAVMGADPRYLPEPVSEALTSRGQSAVRAHLIAEDRPPADLFVDESEVRIGKR